VVAQHAEGEAVRRASEPFVQLGERRLVAPFDESDERLVRQVCEVAAHPNARALARPET
jgi:hypothetical protein